MVIRKMNRMFDLHGRKVFAFITILIIIAFIGFFTPGFASLFAPFFKSEMDTVGTAFGEPVTIEQLRTCANLSTLNLSLQFGIPNLRHPGVRNMAEARAFEDICLMRAANRLGVCVSDKEIAKQISSSSIFQNDGAFDLNKFNSFVKDSLYASGFDKADLDLAVRQGLVLKKLRERVTGWVVTTPNEIKEFYLNTNVKYEVQVAEFKAKDQIDKIKLTEKDVKSFFEMNAKDYQMPPEFKAEIVRFNYQDFKAKAEKEVTDEIVVEEIMGSEDWSIKRERRKFAENLHERVMESLSFEMPKPSAVNVDMVEDFNKKRDDESRYEEFPSEQLKKKTRDALLEKNEKRLALKEAGAFAHTAYKDIEAAEKPADKLAAFKTAAREAGDLPTYPTGWLTEEDESIENVGKEPKLIEAIADIYPEIPVSEPVAGERAAFVAYLISKKPTRQAKLDEVREEVEKTLKNQKAVNAAREAAREAALKVSEALKAGKPFNEAKALAPFSEVPEFSSPRAPVASGEIIAKLASATQPGSLSIVENLPDGALFIYEIKRRLPSEDDFEKEKSVITSRYDSQKNMSVWESYRKWVMGNAQTSLEKKR